MSILSKKEPPMAPPHPNELTLRGGVPTRRHMSEIAAAAAQHVNDLEAEIALHKAELETWKHRALAAEADNGRLKAAIEKAEEQRDLFKERVWNMEARLDDVAAVVMRMVDTKMLPRRSARDEASTKVADAAGEASVKAELKDPALTIDTPSGKIEIG